MKMIDIDDRIGSIANVERTISELLEKSFGVVRDLPPDSVFVIQGDSISVITLMSLIQTSFSVKLDPAQFMQVYSEGPTVRGLATLVTSSVTRQV